MYIHVRALDAENRIAKNATTYAAAAGIGGSFLEIATFPRGGNRSTGRIPY
jgi:hypothetical protein